MTDDPIRDRLPDTRRSLTHKVTITDPASGEHDVFLTVGFYEDGRPGELFMRIGKAGSTLSGLCDTIAILVSFALQYGIPLEALARRLKDTAFPPGGPTSNPAIPTCASLVDYAFRFLEGLTEEGALT